MLQFLKLLTILNLQVGGEDVNENSASPTEKTAADIIYAVVFAVWEGDVVNSLSFLFLKGSRS